MKLLLGLPILAAGQSAIDSDWIATYGSYNLAQDQFYNWRETKAMSGGLQCPLPGISLEPTKINHGLTCYHHPKNGHKFCDLQVPGIRIDPSRISFKAPGGLEAHEIVDPKDCGPLTFLDGWLSIPASSNCQPFEMDKLIKELPNHIPEMIRTINWMATEPCPAVNSARTLLAVQRYEFGNLYHTMTDWFNVCDAIDYLFAKGAIKSFADIDIIFMDTHEKGTLDHIWTEVFGTKVQYITDFTQPLDGVYGRVLFVSPGYSCPITGTWQNRKTRPMLDHSVTMIAFRDFFMKRYGLLGDFTKNQELALIAFDDEQKKSKHPISYPSLDSNIVKRKWLTIILRGEYRPHPTYNGNITRKITNEAEFIESLARKLNAQDPTSEWAVRGVHLEGRRMAEQIALFHTSDVIVSIHGAALSHAVFMRPNTLMVELQPPYYALPHFAPMCAAVGVKHQAIRLGLWGQGPYHLNVDNVSESTAKAIDQHRL